MTAHGGKHQHVLIGQAPGLALESERIAHAVAAQPGGIATLLRPVDRRGDVDAQTQVGGAHRFHEIFGGRSIVKYRRRGGGRIQALDDGPEIRLCVAAPVRQRAHRPGWTQRSSVPRIAQVDWAELQGHFQELPQPGNSILVVFSPAAHGKHDKIVAKAGRIAVSMQGVGHLVTTSEDRASAGRLVIRPSPVLVLARSNLYPSRSRMGASTWSSPSGPQRVPTPRATTVSNSFSASQTSRTISSVRATGTLISTIADISFSPRMSSRSVPLPTSVISDVIGFRFSKDTPAAPSRQHICWISRIQTPTPGRPSSMVNPTSPTFTRPVMSFVLTSSVPRPSMPVDSCGTRGSENARRTTRGHTSSSGSKAAVGQTSGSGSNRTRIAWNIFRMSRTSVGFRCSWLSPLKHA